MRKIELPPRGLETLFGVHDQNIKHLESLLDVRVDVRGQDMKIDGAPKDVATVEAILSDFAALFQEGHQFTDKELREAFAQIAEDRAYRLRDYFTNARFNPSGKKLVAPKTANQRRYLEAISKNDVVFGIGVAGTGKTFLAVAKAVHALTQKKVNRIILTRPAVEAGEKLGYLPGDLQEKIDPYLRPLYDALYDLMEHEKVTKFMEKRVIEIAPLAFMRGRAQPLDSRIMTPTGWRRMGDLATGDVITGSDGQPTRVTGVYPQGPKPVYRVTMTDGASTLACAEHLWQVRTASDKRREKPARVLETQEMMGNLKCFHQYRYELPLLSAPVRWAAQDVPLEPYLLSRGRPVCLPDVTGLLPTGRHTGLLPTGRHANLLPTGRHTGLLPTGRHTGLPLPFIPEIYLYNSFAVRHAVLQGLLDTDGGPVLQNGRTCRVQYATTSAQLKDDVLFLVRSLGGVAYWRARRAEGRKPGWAQGRAVPYRHDAYVLDIRLPEGVAPFRLSRKASLYETYGGGRPMRFIKSIEPVGIMETQCISVSAADALYVTDDFIVTHNTLSDAFIILDEAQNTTSEQMKMFLTRIGFGSQAVITGDVTQIDLPRGQRSGLVEAERILQGIEGIGFVHFTEKDVVRHRLVQMIIKAYETHNAGSNF